MAELSPSLSADASSEREVERPRSTGSFVGVDDQDVLGDMDAALDSLLWEDLGVGKSEGSASSVSEPVAETSAPTPANAPPAPASKKRIGSRRRALHLPERERAGEDRDFKSVEKSATPKREREGEFTAISPVDPEEWEEIVKNVRLLKEAQESGENLTRALLPAAPIPSPSEVVAATQAAFDADSNATSELPTTGAMRGRRGLPRPPMVGAPTRRVLERAGTTSKEGQEDAVHQPDATELIQLKDLQGEARAQVAQARAVAAASRKRDTGDSEVYTPPESTEKMFPGDWSDPASFFSREQKVRRTEPTAIEDIEELGL